MPGQQELLYWLQVQLEHRQPAELAVEGEPGEVHGAGQGHLTVSGNYSFAEPIKMDKLKFNLAQLRATAN